LFYEGYSQKISTKHERQPSRVVQDAGDKKPAKAVEQQLGAGQQFR
jgi:hypothetical protein